MAYENEKEITSMPAFPVMFCATVSSSQIVIDFELMIITRSRKFQSNNSMIVTPTGNHQ